MLLRIALVAALATGLGGGIGWAVNSTTDSGNGYESRATRTLAPVTAPSTAARPLLPVQVSGTANMAAASGPDKQAL